MRKQCLRRQRSPAVSLALLIPTFTTDDMVVSSTTSDLNGDNVTLTYEWFRNQTLVQSETGPVVASSDTQKGEEWMVTVTPNDGQVDGPKLSVWTTILNSKLCHRFRVGVPNHWRREYNFASTPLNDSDADNDSVNFTYQWSVNGQPSAFSPSINGQLFDAETKLSVSSHPTTAKRTVCRCRRRPL